MKVLIVGTNFTSPNDLKTQGQFLNDLLTHWQIDSAIISPARNYIIRIWHSIYYVLRLPKKTVIIVQVYSTKSIYLECLTVLLAFVCGKKIVLTLHGGAIPEVYKLDYLKRPLLTLMFRLADAITCPSTFIEEKIPDIQQKNTVIRNYVPTGQYINQTKPNDTIRIFWMRAYHKAYNPIKAVNVIIALHQKGFKAQMIMTGKDLGNQKEVKKHIEANGLKDYIEVNGVIDDTQKNAIASMCTIYLCTNDIDNAPVTFIEMMALGLPIVTTSIGGIPHYVHHQKTALLSIDNSPENLAELIIKCHNDNILHNNLIQNGLLFTQEFSAEIIASKWLQLITQLTD
jgi:glycosyltransferase involved in cell wall biosynthesis